MTSVTGTSRDARGLSDVARRRQRSQRGRVGIRGSLGDARTDREARPAVLRCPGPLVALRGLAALYGVPVQRLAACLQTLDQRTRTGAPGVLQNAVSDALACSPRTPTAVHYFHATRLRDPQLVLTLGLRPSPVTPDGVWRSLGEVVAHVTPADWASLQPTAQGRHNALYTRLLQAADALHPGPRGSLVCDLLLRPARYGMDDHLELPALVQDLAVACRPILGFDIADRFSRATTPCIVEYRRRPARDGQDIEAALSFVEAALRGTVSRSAVGGQDAHGTPIAAHDIVAVRATVTQTEWTPAHRRR